MQYNSWLYLFPFLGGSIILYYLIPVKRRWIGLLFSSLLFYILAMKNLVAVVLFTTATIYLGARTIEEFNEQFKLKKKELDRAARKELKSKITKKNRYVSLISVFYLSQSILTFLVKISTLSFMHCIFPHRFHS